MQWLDETATWKLSYTVWDMFAYPDSNKSNWKEDCLSYSPGATVNLGTRMPGIWLALHDATGRYQGMVRVLKFEGHMLVYDPLTNGAGWIPMRGVSSSLMAVKLWSTGDLGNFYPCPSVVPAGPEPSQPLPTGDGHKICAGQGWVITVHLDRTQSDLPCGTLKKCEIGHAHQAPLQSPQCLHGVRQWRRPHQWDRIMHLVAEHFMGSRAGSPWDYAPIAETTEKTPPAEDTGKTPPTEQVEDAPTDEQEPAHITPVEDDVVELHVGTGGPWLVPCGIKLVIKLSVNNIKCQIRCASSCWLIMFLSFFILIIYNTWCA